MATTPQKIATSVTTSTTTLYSGFVAGGASRGMGVSLNFCNTSTADINLSVWLEVGASTLYLCKTFPVPAGGMIGWGKGMVVIDASGDKIRASASTNGIDCLGAVVENA